MRPSAAKRSPSRACVGGLRAEHLDGDVAEDVLVEHPNDLAGPTLSDEAPLDVLGRRKAGGAPGLPRALRRLHRGRRGPADGCRAEGPDRASRSPAAGTNHPSYRSSWSPPTYRALKGPCGPPHVLRPRRSKHQRGPAGNLPVTAPRGRTETMSDPTPSGASFLWESAVEAPRRIMAPELFTEEQREIARAARKFSAGEIVPRIAQIESKKAGLVPGPLAEGGRARPPHGGHPHRVRRPGARQDDQHAHRRGVLGRSAPSPCRSGAHTGIGTMPILYFGTPEQKAKYLPGPRDGPAVRRLRAHRAVAPGPTRSPRRRGRTSRTTAATTS